MRIIAGSLKGRKIKLPAGRENRLTTDFVREAVFSILQNSIPGSVFLDCFAGSGLMGIEALSRGAAFATFIEGDRERCHTLLTTLQSLPLDSESYEVAAGDAVRRLKKMTRTFSVIFIDPPYFVNLYEPVWLTLLGSVRIKEGSLVVFETHRKAPLPASITAAPELTHLSQKRYGTTVIDIFQVNAAHVVR